MLLLGILLVIAFGMFSLLNKGALSDTDEFPFVVVLEQFDLLIKLNSKAWMNLTLHADYPIFAIATRLIQSVFIKIYVQIHDIHPLSEEALRLCGIFNVFVSLISLYFFFRILKNLNFTFFRAVTGMLLLATLLNTNLYIRHLLSYDQSLLFYLIALYYLTKSTLTRKRLFFAGVFMAFGFLSYFGYFTFYFILVLYILIQSKHNYKLLLNNLFFTGLPLILMLCFIEVVAFINGDSYILHNFYFAQSIVQGSPSEALIFIFKYFYQVEKIWGITIMVFFLAFCVKLCTAHFKNKTIQLEQHSILIVLAIAMYFIYGLYAYLSDNVVYYGRLLHMYYPFIILGTISVIKNYNIFAWFLIIGSVLNYSFVLKQLYRIDYPRSIIQANNYFESKSNDLNFINETDCGVQLDQTSSRFIGKSHSINKIGKLILVNFCFFKHYPNDFLDSYNSYKPSENLELISEKNHFMSFPAYTFEYCNNKGRDYFIKHDFKIRVYRPK